MNHLRRLRGGASSAAPALGDFAATFTLGRTREPVEWSEELERVISLPVREPVDLESLKGQALVELMTRRLAKPAGPCKCRELGRSYCITRLLPAQAWALYEAPLAGGLLAPIGVGHGKTGLDILMPLVMPNCKQVALLIPPGLVSQLEGDYKAWAQHFRVPSIVLPNGRGHIVPGSPVIHVVPFSKLSRPEATVMLETLAPDLVIIDEAHKARHPETATTARILRLFEKNRETRLCCWSGTLTSKSIKDYWHLAGLSLKEGSPLPLDPQVVHEWSLAIDPIDWPAAAGALRRLQQGKESLHEGFHRRLVSTLGVVSTTESAVKNALVINERKAPEVPQQIQDMLKVLRGEWVRPDGEELVDILAVAKSAQELACGFFYRWKFPRGESADLIDRWFKARKAWHRELREKVKERTEHMDSPNLCTKAAIRHYQGMVTGEPYRGDLPTWASKTWPAWRDIRDKVQPEPDTVWVDDYLARDAAAWAKKHRGVVWYAHTAFGRRVAELSGLVLHEGGPDAEERIKAEAGDRSIIASIKAHGTGRDGLQRLFQEQLVANPPASAEAWEQLLGRLHRIGQTGDEVTTYVYRHTAEMADSIDKAVRYAKYIQGTLGTLQKLLSADVTWVL